MFVDGTINNAKLIICNSVAPMHSLAAPHLPGQGCGSALPGMAETLDCISSALQN